MHGYSINWINVRLLATHIDNPLSPDPSPYFLWECINLNSYNSTLMFIMVKYELIQDPTWEFLLCYLFTFFPLVLLSVTYFGNIHLGWGVIQAMGWRIIESWNWEEVPVVLWCQREEGWRICMDSIQGTESIGLNYVCSS